LYRIPYNPAYQRPTVVFFSIFFCCRSCWCLSFCFPFLLPLASRNICCKFLLPFGATIPSARAKWYQLFALVKTAMVLVKFSGLPD